MQRRLLAVLACPRCAGALTCTAESEESSGVVREGMLGCSCGAEFPITNGIPRFVERDNYAASFGFQWQRFRREQLDSYNGTQLSRARLLEETQWSPDDVRGGWVLDVGCGAGRFLDAISGWDVDVVGVDLSDAVDAALDNLQGRTNVHLVQASVYDLPFRKEAFTGVYCLGVLQHTPDPDASLAALPPLLRPDGQLAITAYERSRWTVLNGKYLLRSVTRRIPDQRLLSLVTTCMPVLFAITDVLFRLPILGRFFRFAIPVANWVELTELSRKQRYEWAVLDTFDALAPRHDHPMTREQVTSVLAAHGMHEVTRVPTAGLTMVARRTGSARTGGSAASS